MSDNRRQVSREEEARRRRREQRLREERRRKKRRIAIMIRIGCIVVLILIIIGVVFGTRSCSRRRDEKEAREKARQEALAREEEEKRQQNQNVLAQAEALAVQYDYDGAIALLKSVEGYEEDTSLTAKITAYEKDKSALVEWDVNQVEHIFFRHLIVDQERALASEDAAVQAASQDTMTVEAFGQTLQQMYEEGYILVSIRDLVTEEKDEEGNVTYKKAELKLPSGKKPFVLSQEDVSYPFALTTAGYGARIVAGEDGKPAVEYRQADGSVVIGDYDVVPCLDAFIEEHPEFAYRGARGILGVSGYNGVLGYRTDEVLGKSGEAGNPYADYGVYDTAAETAACQAVIQLLKEDGWEFASNGYGGLSYASTLDRVQADAQKWSERVGSLIGGTDLLFYPEGTDIGSWTDYDSENQKFTYLKSMGFSFFFNRDDANTFWVQVRPSYVRQARRKL